MLISQRPRIGHRLVLATRGCGLFSSDRRPSISAQRALDPARLRIDTDLGGLSGCLATFLQRSQEARPFSGPPHWHAADHVPSGAPSFPIVDSADCAELLASLTSHAED